MNLHLISIANKMPSWVDQGYAEYEKRLKPHWPLHHIDIPLIKRTGNNPAPFIEKEAKQMLGKIPEGSYVIALDVLGKTLSTEALAEKLDQLQTTHRHVTFLIGGPEGLHPDCLARADTKISLSGLTFPHPLVRVILAEQLYRAWSVTAGHPYHK